MRIRISMAILLSSLILLSGCAGVFEDKGYFFDPGLYDQVIDQTSDRFPEIDPLFLSDEIKLRIEDYIGTDPRSDKYLVNALQDLMYGESHLNIQYSDEKTYTAVEVFETRLGNCLSVMNLYVAMARHVGLDANFQTVELQPDWDIRGNFLVVSKHINATGRLGLEGYYVADFAPEIALREVADEVVSDDVARSLYFNNLGVEALLAGDIDRALAYIKNALFIDPSNSDAWNNLGTAYSRLGDRDLTEFSYHFAFAIDRSNATAINNLAKLYRKQGLDERARLYERVIDSFNRRNPYFQYAQGTRAQEQGYFETARGYFQRAIQLKDDDPNFHLRLAGVYVQLGEIDQARNARDTAEMMLVSNGEEDHPGLRKLIITERKINRIDTRSILRPSSPGTIYEPQTGVHTLF